MNPTFLPMHSVRVYPCGAGHFGSSFRMCHGGNFLIQLAYLLNFLGIDLGARAPESPGSTFLFLGATVQSYRLDSLASELDIHQKCIE